MMFTLGLLFGFVFGYILAQILQDQEGQQQLKDEVEQWINLTKDEGKDDPRR